MSFVTGYLMCGYANGTIWLFDNGCQSFWNINCKSKLCILSRQGRDTENVHRLVVFKEGTILSNNKQFMKTSLSRLSH